MSMEPVNAALGHSAGKDTLKFNRPSDRAVRHPQWISRRLAASHLLADGFLQIDDGARLIHGLKLAPYSECGERLFQYPPAASLKV